MNLRARSLIVIATAIGMTLAGILGVAAWLILPSIQEIEKTEARRNAVRVVEILQRDLDALNPMCKDWGFWDDTYEFIRSPNAGYVASNLQLGSLQSLRVNYLAIVSPQRRVIAKRLRDDADSTGFDIPDLNLTEIPATHAFLRIPDGRHAISGMLRTDAGAMLFCTAHVTNSAQDASHSGYLIFGRLVDAEELRQIARQSEMDIEIGPIDADASKATSNPPSIDRLNYTPFTLTIEDQRIIANSRLLDVFGQPLLQLGVRQNRHISAQVDRAVRAFVLIAILIALATATLTYFLMDRGIFEGVRRMARQMRRMSEQPLELRPISEKEPGELGAVAKEFNGLLAQLERTRKLLAEQNFRRGASEIASSLIANLRPQVLRLEELCENTLGQLDKVQVGNQQLLIKQLNERNDCSPAIHDGLNLLRSEIGDSATFLTESRSELRALRRSLSGLSMRIADFNKYYSDSAQSVALDVVPLIDHALEALELQGRSSYGIEVLRSAQPLPLGFAPREVLQQVLVTLLHFLHDVALRFPNANPHPLRIGIKTDNPSLPMLIISFDDGNAGPGIPEFTDYLRGYGERRNAAGLDPSWMHAAVSAMGGALHIEALAHHHGLRATLSLPVAR